MTTQAAHRKARAKSYTHCQRCGGLKDAPKGRVVSAAEVAADPYCSTACCRLEHGLPLISKGTTS